jgi:flagellar hook-associated protein 1
MGSLSASLNIAAQSLLADETAIQTTTNNIANANTPGYSREVANFEDNPPIQVGDLTLGSGVNVASITSQRSAILDLRVNQETQQQGTLNELVSSGQQIQALFNETSGTGLQAPLTAFFNSLSQLSADPSDADTRQGVLTAAQNLATAFNQAASGLSQIQSSENLGVTQSVSQINTLTSQIATLNTQISAASGGGQNSGPLTDQRQQLLSQLSNLVDISEINAGNGSLTITTTSGAPLVVGGQNFQLTTQANATNGFQDVYSQGNDITTQITGGQLAGQIQIRDQEIPSIQSQLDSLASNLANAVNTQNAQGYDLNGNAGGNIFVPPPANGVGAAANLAVAITSGSQIAASAGPAPGNSGDNTNANALLNIQNENIVNGQTPLNAYSNLVYNIGNFVSTAQSNQNTGTAVLQQLQDLQGGVSGVDINEESANLVRFQAAYQASAQISGIIDELMQTTIDMVPLTT